MNFRCLLFLYDTNVHITSIQNEIIIPNVSLSSM